MLESIDWLRVIRHMQRRGLHAVCTLTTSVIPISQFTISSDVLALKHKSRILTLYLVQGRTKPAQSPTCSFMEKPHTGLDILPRILLLCFRARNSEYHDVIFVFHKFMKYFKKLPLDSAKSPMGTSSITYQLSRIQKVPFRDGSWFVVRAYSDNIGLWQTNLNCFE